MQQLEAPRLLALKLAGLQSSAVIELSPWMRRALFATAVMNAGGAAFFTPPAQSLRDAIGMPGAHPLYLLTVAFLVGLFGAGYLWTALAGRADRMFISLAAAGKIGFFGITAWLWAAGELPAVAPLLAIGDLVFGVIFVAWLTSAAAAPVARTTPASAHR